MMSEERSKRFGQDWISARINQETGSVHVVYYHNMQRIASKHFQDWKHFLATDDMALIFAYCEFHVRYR